MTLCYYLFLCREKAKTLNTAKSYNLYRYKKTKGEGENEKQQKAEYFRFILFLVVLMLSYSIVGGGNAEVKRKK